MNLLKLGDCWINPKHISCAKIKEKFDAFKNKTEYNVVVFCYGNAVACINYDHREDAETILNEVVVKAMDYGAKELEKEG